MRSRLSGSGFDIYPKGRVTWPLATAYASEPNEDRDLGMGAANARLIAAAPDQNAALREAEREIIALVRFIEHPDLYSQDDRALTDKALNQIRTAIERAENDA
jgi:hypothetical protein